MVKKIWQGAVVGGDRHLQVLDLQLAHEGVTPFRVVVVST